MFEQHPFGVPGNEAEKLPETGIVFSEERLRELRSRQMDTGNENPLSADEQKELGRLCEMETEIKATAEKGFLSEEERRRYVELSMKISNEGMSEEEMKEFKPLQEKKDRENLTLH